MNKFLYIFYFTLYSIISHTTDYGFDYNNAFELMWGSALVALISSIIENIIFKISYKLTGSTSILLSHNKEERRVTHWIFRTILASLVLLISITPLCSKILTPLVHSTYEILSSYFHKLLNEISESIINAFIS